MKFIKPRTSYLRNILYTRWIKSWRLIKPKYTSMTHFLYFFNNNLNKKIDVTIPAMLNLLKKDYYDRIHRKIITKKNNKIKKIKLTKQNNINKFNKFNKLTKQNKTNNLKKLNRVLYGVLKAYLIKTKLNITKLTSNHWKIIKNLCLEKLEKLHNEQIKQRIKFNNYSKKRMWKQKE